MTNRVQRIRQGWASHLNPFADAYGLVVLLLLTLLIVPVFTVDRLRLGVLLVVLLAGATAIISLAASRAPMWMTSMTALMTLIAAVATLLGDPPSPLIRLGFLGLAVALLISPVAILSRIVRHRVVTPRTVLGSIAVYLQVGVAFAIAYLELWRIDPSSFPAVTDIQAGTFLYFSFITLNTVGFGDIVPTTELGRTLSIFEALIGQIFLVVVVARVISLLGPSTRGSDDAAE